jgi:hypothetical protein
MADETDEEMVEVPIPGEEDEAERARIRSSNDRDQELEREGKRSRHNRGYDEAADGGAKLPEVENVVEKE